MISVLNHFRKLIEAKLNKVRYERDLPPLEWRFSMESVTKLVLPELRYSSSQDVNMRLKSTLVSYKGEPVYCTGAIAVGSDLTGLHVILHRIKDGQTFYAHSSDVELDVTSLPLGWINWSYNNAKVPLFLCRTTRTSQKQGVCLSSVLVTNPRDRGHGGMGLNWNSVPELKPLLDCINDRVFSIRDTTSYAFGGVLSREWALVREMSQSAFVIYHRSVEVGTYFSKTREFFFRRGRLTKTRRVQLQEIFDNPVNSGVRYAISEQT